MADDVTMGEVVRRLDNIAGQLAQITTSLAEDRRHNTETFVRKDVFEDGVQRRVKELEDDRDKQQDRNRGMVIALIGIAVPALISIVGLILTVLGAGATP